MSPWSVGSRIAAVRDATDSVVHLYGRGVYAGDFPRPGSGNWSEAYQASAEKSILQGEAERSVDELVSWVASRLDRDVMDGRVTQEEADSQLAESRRKYEEDRARPVRDKAIELLHMMDLNPRLDLDNGSTVWGCECWWMPEEEFADFLGSRTVVEVPEPVRGTS